MRILYFILSIFICNTVFAAKSDTVGLWKAVYGLNEALIYKDSVTLKKVLHPKLSYGHSNGWSETKEEVIGDLYNGKLIYRDIGQKIDSWEQEENLVLIRSTTDIDVLLEGKEVKLRLHVLQVWIRKNKTWQLISRQSTRIN